ncbi:MAG: hypothetical protein ACP5HS_03870 [Anaerolineae bacterium]
MRDSSVFKSWMLGLLAVGLVSGMLYVLLSYQDASVSAAAPTSGLRDDAVTGVLTDGEYSYVFLPIVYRDFGPRSSRLGYCALSRDVSRYPDIRKLSAGWYLQFTTNPAPPQPMGIEHVQVVRLHQNLECEFWTTRDRDVCPYSDPPTYTIWSPSGGIPAIRDIAAANPGALWLIGNEMDRPDWDGGGQDEMLPELYAHAYHEIHGAIKAADPTAQVAIGGVIQATKVRMEYLTKVWEEYARAYEGPMPVDVWNVHNFIFQELSQDPDCWEEFAPHGADVPPGYEKCSGATYDDELHNSMVLFDAQIRRFRQWMKDHGQQNKPLVVSEYGIVYHHAGMEDFDLVKSFMLDTFNYFLTTKDTSLGYPADDHRLVQRWAWYSLDDNNFNINQYSYLINPDSGFLTPLGHVYADYAQNHLDSP